MESMSREHIEELAMQYASRWASPSNSRPDYRSDVENYLAHYDKYMKEILRQCCSNLNP